MESGLVRQEMASGNVGIVMRIVQTAPGIVERRLGHVELRVRPTEKRLRYMEIALGKQDWMLFPRCRYFLSRDFVLNRTHRLPTVVGGRKTVGSLPDVSLTRQSEIADHPRERVDTGCVVDCECNPQRNLP